MEPIGSSAVASGGRRKREGPSKPVIAVIAAGVGLLIGIGMWLAIGAALFPGSSRDAQGSDAEPQPGQIDVFTLVESGIVFVDPDTSEIIWRDALNRRNVIGEQPWRHPDTRQGLAWGEDRDIVGNPDYNVVSWVETVDGRRGDIVVVDARTGSELARTAIEAPADRFVVIASVDGESVYFATVDPGQAHLDVPGADIWVWRWAAGEPPESRPRDPSYVNDVSAGVRAVYTDSGVRFDAADGQVLSSFEPASDFGLVSVFGSSLSPDGRFWYGAGAKIVDTATGESVPVIQWNERAYGWTAVAELTLGGSQLVCNAATGECEGPTDVPSQGVCFRFGLDCGHALPSN